MPLDNSLNVAELLRRLGLKGDSLGSMPLLESLRLTLSIGDLSALVPPLGVPLGGSSIVSTSGVATVNSWSLQCNAPGGVRVLHVYSNVVSNFFMFVTAATPFGAIAASGAHNFSFGQPVESLFSRHVPAAAAVPANAFGFQGNEPSTGPQFDNWIGPGEFFNIEASSLNLTQRMTIFWKEYPAALNP